MCKTKNEVSEFQPVIKGPNILVSTAQGDIALKR